MGRAQGIIGNELADLFTQVIGDKRGLTLQASQGEDDDSFVFTKQRMALVLWMIDRGELIYTSDFVLRETPVYRGGRRSNQRQCEDDLDFLVEQGICTRVLGSGCVLNHIEDWPFKLQTQFSEWRKEWYEMARHPFSQS